MLLRRVVTAVPVVLLLVAGGGQAVATGDSLPDAFEHDKQRAADGVRPHAGADTWAEGVTRRHTTMSDVESTSTNPQHQLTSVDVAVDLETQTFAATASFAQLPTDADAVLGVGLGTWSGDVCRSSLVAVTTTVSGAVQAAFEDGTDVPLTRQAQAAGVRITSAPHPRIRETEFECAYALVLENNPEAAVLSRVFAEPLEETHRPVLEVEPDDLMVGARAGRWATLRVTVGNDGKGDAGPVRLSASGAGVQVEQPEVEVGAIRGGSSEHVELKVRLVTKKKAKGKKGKKKRKVADPRPRTLTLTATATNAQPVTAQTTVAITPRPTVPRKLTGTYWWGWESTTTMDTAGWSNHAVWFVDKKWAYVGWADGRRPKCSARVKECQRYSYNERTGKVRIGRKRAKVTSEGFAFVHPGAGEKIGFHPLALAAKGTKLQTELIHQNWSGNCMLMCNSWTEDLSFAGDGRFVRGRLTVGSWPGLGAAWGSVGPDQRGTYRVVSKGIIELAFDDGTRSRHVIGIEHDPSGKPNPVAAGLLVDDTNFYPR